MPKKGFLKDITGMRYGMLVVLSAAPMKTKCGHQYWNCQCDCGKSSLVSGNNLRACGSKSCGCVKGNLKHGRRHTPEYEIWKGMKQRCLNSRNNNYKNYGGRGITVCDRWRASFENFYADMGPRPSQELSIERKNNNGNYEPGNCVWASLGVQVRNKRSNRWLVINGARMTLADAAKVAGITMTGMRYRLRAWHPDLDVLQPSRSQK